MDEAEYCSRVSIMVDGKVKALGSPAELKKQYAVGSMDEVFRILLAALNGENRYGRIFVICQKGGFAYFTG